MSGYQPIFRSILQSSIARDYVVRHVFEDLLKLADWNDGEVDMTYDAIARQTGMPEEMVREAIKKLMQPDPESRNQDEEGRRLVPIDEDRSWGWRIVTFQFYREQIRLDGKRRRQQAYRDKNRAVKASKAMKRADVTEARRVVTPGDTREKGGARDGRKNEQGRREELP